MKTTRLFLTLLMLILAYTYFDYNNHSDMKAYMGDETMCKTWPNNNNDYYILEKCK